MNKPTYEELLAHINELTKTLIRIKETSDSYYIVRSIKTALLDTPEHSIKTLKSECSSETANEIMHCLFYAPSSPVKPQKAEEIRIWWKKYKESKGSANE